jgi:ATP-binding cassette subfamily C (CFTR/MRP) protein 1
MSCFSDIVKSLTEVRSMKLKEFFMAKIQKCLNENQKNSVLISGANCWFSWRVSMYNILLVQIPCYGFLLWNLSTGIDTVKIAMIVIYTSNITSDAINFLQVVSDMETAFISVERCSKFEAIAPEKNYLDFAAEEQKMTNLPTKAGVLKPYDYAPALKIRNYKIITNGNVKFTNVSANYPMKAENVLKNLNFTVKAGQKIGVVGRTGAGKTSLIRLFWRCLDPCQGEIIIDGKNIKDCNLKDLRNEMDVVSQETSLFEGNLRENLDPQSSGANDDELLSILDRLQFKNGVEINLGMQIESDGQNLSVGERQIICFARILLSRRKLVILDEATANIDLQTEGCVQDFLLSAFEESTMFIIAHRVQTVMHCDKIMALRFGEIIEFDSPQNLLAKENGYFRDIYDRMIDG